MGLVLNSGSGSSYERYSSGGYAGSAGGSNLKPGTSVRGASVGAGVGNYALLQQQRDYNNDWNSAQVASLNAFNAAEAQKNRDWQKMMSDTAHQREIADLKAAGLNPVLSAFGSGAAVGTGAQASGSKAQADDTLSNGMISLMGAMIAASSAATVANIYTQNQRYMAENYPSNLTQLINAVLSSNDGSASGISNAKGFLGGLFDKLKSNDYSSGTIKGRKFVKG